MRNSTLLVAASLAIGASCFGVTPAQAQAMLTSGQAGVSSGAAGYTVPIRVPPGTAGVAPQLAFVYNSQAGNGPLGIGWNLSGLSAITRCPRTRSQDDGVGAIQYDLSDRYCLDGQRLIVANGGAYGADATEYRTEIDGFSKIVSYGSAGSAGPLWFKAWTKAGEIIEYGNTLDSRIEAQGASAVRVWAINRLSDTRNNYQDFVYTEDAANGDYNINLIRYTGNTGPIVTAPNAEVRFIPETRSDVQDLRQGGHKITATTRLKTVETWSGTTKVREYRLTYAPYVPERQSQITAIQECPGKGTCLPAVQMTWNQHIDQLIDAGVAAANAHGGFHDDPERISVGDFNGDGRLDLVLGPNASGNWYVMPATGAGLGQGLTPWIPGAYSGWTSSGDAERIRPMDVNGDGRSDMVIGPSSSGKWYVLRSTGSAFVDTGDWAAATPGGLYEIDGVRHD